MQRLKVLGLALLGVMVLSAVAVATASAALPSALNAAKVEAFVKFTGKGGTAVLQILKGIIEGVECASQTNEGEIEAGKPLGTVHVTFAGCHIKGVSTATCTGLGDASGVILALFAIHLVDEIVAGKLMASILFLITTPVHFACTLAGVVKLILVKGELLCLVSPENVLVTEATVSCQKGAEPGDPAITKYLNTEGKEVELKEGLLSSESDGGEFKMSSQVAESSLVPAAATEIMA